MLRFKVLLINVGIGMKREVYLKREAKFIYYKIVVFLEKS